MSQLILQLCQHTVTTEAHIRLSDGIYNSNIPECTFPSLPWMTVIPFGRFPSLLDRPWGFLTNRMSASVTARAIKSLMMLCRACLLALSLHDRPSRPVTSTKAPQGHWCSLQNAVPSRKPTVTRMKINSM